ncbi:hypothetical protein DENSPDRAFT_746024, partial [Dentipellis sp. KUC8613]
LLTPSAKRFVLFPLVEPSLWESYKVQSEHFWTAEQCGVPPHDSLTHDGLPKPVRMCLARTAALFASTYRPGGVIQSAVLSISSRLHLPEARTALGWHVMQYNVHVEVACSIVDFLIGDSPLRGLLFDSV